MYPFRNTKAMNVFWTILKIGEGKANYCYSSVKEIAETAHMSQAAVRNALDVMIESGLLSVRERIIRTKYGEPERIQTRYQLHERPVPKHKRETKKVIADRLDCVLDSLANKLASGEFTELEHPELKPSPIVLLMARYGIKTTESVRNTIRHCKGLQFTNDGVQVSDRLKSNSKALELFKELQKRMKLEIS
jgi:predicted transcriptional regulator